MYICIYLCIHTYIYIYIIYLQNGRSREDACVCVCCVHVRLYALLMRVRCMCIKSKKRKKEQCWGFHQAARFESKLFICRSEKFLNKRKTYKKIYIKKKDKSVCVRLLHAMKLGAIVLLLLLTLLLLSRELYKDFFPRDLLLTRWRPVSPLVAIK